MRSVKFGAAATAAAWLAMACGSGIDTNGEASGGAAATGSASGAGTSTSAGSGASPPHPDCAVAPVGGKANKVDLLIVMENSRSLGAQRDMVVEGTPELLDLLANPPCLDENGALVAIGAQPTQACPEGSARPYEPVRDIHVGMVTASLGGLGADACSPAFAGYHPMQNEKAHLVAREEDGVTPLPTYQDLGFVVYDPDGSHDPPGEDNLGNVQLALGDIIAHAGILGCGYESHLESWYRFLIEPEPYAEIQLDAAGEAQLVGTDAELLSQRSAFLRDDSVLIVMQIGDEDDCSTIAGGYNYLVRQLFDPSGSQFRLPKPRAACATDPNDPCCTSCGEEPPDGCDTSNDDCGPLAQIDDAINMRCFDQKRRFGFDASYPIERYRDGLSCAVVPNRAGEMVPNPLFSHGKRDPSMVHFVTFGGTPWVNIARDGDLTQGNMSAAELRDSGRWDVILGSPDCYHSDASCLPTDPHMIASIDPRAGTHPLTGVSLAPPGAGYLADPINGHEYSIPSRDDLQYSAIFPLAEPLDCTQEEVCSCFTPDNDNPLCQAPDGSFGTTQYHAASYPQPRNLLVARTLGDQAVVGSLQVLEQVNDKAADYLLRPALVTLTRDLGRSLE